MQKRNRFIKGAGGVYKCRCCGRGTRSTGNGDNEHVKLCEQCYEMGGIENSIEDGNYEDETGKAKLIEEIKALAAVITARGGKAESDYL